MKYIIGASIGGLFGFSMPIMMDIKKANDNEVPRIEDSQPVEEAPPAPIVDKLILPDNTCEIINYKSQDIKEQAKECLNRSLPAIPAI